jgi:sulfur-oxidizing protein SoxY
MAHHMPTPSGAPSRRQFIGTTGAVAAAVSLSPAALAKPDDVTAAIKKLYGDTAIAAGKIKLDLPTIAENGLVVPLNFEVESPMSEKDYVKSVHFFADGNPQPGLASFHFTPMSPKAAAQIRIRLAQTQNIVAVAEMSDGKLYTAKKEVKVTIGGCGG